MAGSYDQTGHATNNEIRNRQIRVKWQPAFDRLCGAFDTPMKYHCEALEQQMIRFQQEKAAIVANVEESVGEEHAHRALDEILVDLMPQSLRRLIVLISSDGMPVPEAVRIPPCQLSASETSAPDTCLAFLARQPLGAVNTQGSCSRLANIDMNSQLKISPARPRHLALSSFTNHPPISYAVANVQTENNMHSIVEKHKTGHFTLSLTQTPESKGAVSGIKPVHFPKPVLPDISTWEVEAVGYLFQYAPLGPGWFVLRNCHTLDPDNAFFKKHPLQTKHNQSGLPLGLHHFNMETCKYHNNSKTYTEMDMMIEFAQRVIDEENSDISDDWAHASNEDLREEIAKLSAKLAARSGARKSKGGNSNRRKRKAATEEYHDVMARIKEEKEDLGAVPIMDDNDNMTAEDDDYELIESTDSSTISDGAMSD